MPSPLVRNFTLASACILALAPAAALATAPVPPVAAGDLADLSLEDLMDLEVTSVSKKAEKLSDSAAAIYVITNEDIRRSGATSIPEALRMAPGVQVAQISANRWAISARGFNGEFANKLLVLIDGRSVYTPLFSGVFWDVQDVMLEDVARIEVIRGPGATLWGANAVNGVINVITRSAEETQGALLVSGAGSNERAFGSMRWGGKVGEDVHYRVYGKYFDRDGFQTPEGDNAEDGWKVGRGGFRVDWELDDDDALTLQGDYYLGEVGERHVVVESIVPPVTPLTDENADIEGWNAQARWTHRFSETSELSLQSYFDRTKRDIEFASETRDTVDVDFQHRFALGGRQEILWGTGYRWTQDRTRGSQRVYFDPDKRHDNLFSAFAQNEIALVKERLYLTLGSKIEHNDYTGFEYQPSGRLLFKPHEQHTLWASVARAVRTPSRAGEDVALTQEVAPPGGPPLFLPVVQVTHLDGDADIKSEEMLAYEAGYRFTPSPRFSADVALFYNDYDNVRSIEFVGLDFATVPGAAILNNAFGNEFGGESYGAEIASRWDVLPWWQLSGSYSYMTLNLNSRGSTDTTTEASTEGAVPTHMFNLRSFVDLPGNFEFDTMLYYVENLPSGGVPSYTRIDLRLGWRPRPDLRLSLIGQNLQEAKHSEFNDTLLWPASKSERGVYGKVEWSF
jgi:iron complex outermembrane receptor protein